MRQRDKVERGGRSQNTTRPEERRRSGEKAAKKVKQWLKGVAARDRFNARESERWVGKEAEVSLRPEIGRESERDKVKEEREYALCTGGG